MVGSLIQVWNQAPYRGGILIHADFMTASFDELITTVGGDMTITDSSQYGAAVSCGLFRQNSALL